jgi:hypothetical protein
MTDGLSGLNSGAHDPNRRKPGRCPLVRVRLGPSAVVYRSPQNDTQLALFHTTSAVVPIDPAGLYDFSSSSESDVMILLLSMPSKFGYELLST